MRFRPFAIPLIIALICASIVASMALAGLVGAGLGMAVGALAATALVVFASRAKPDRRLEVAECGGQRPPRAGGRRRRGDRGLRAAHRGPRGIGRRTSAWSFPFPSHRLDRWLSAEDDARREAEGRLARSAGALVAAGLPVSGSVGDHDPAQALEDELRDFPADEVVLLIANGKDPLAKVERRLGIPLRRVGA